MRAALIALLLAGGCAKDLAPAPIDVSRPECENLNPGACMAPWPSSRYLGPDGIDIPAEALLVNKEGEAVRPEPYERFDGFGLSTPIVTVVPADVDATSLADETRIADSLLATSPTWIVDTETGQPVPHFAEIDRWPGNPPDRVALYLRPIRPFAPGRRYIVVIRGLVHEDGSPVEAAPFFRALREGFGTNIAEVEARREEFEAIFATLEEAGVVRDELIEAWEFRTGTHDSYRRDMQHVIDDARGRIGEGGIGCTVTDVQEDFGHAELYLRVDGTITVPLYVEDEASASPLVRGADDLPRFNRMGEAQFTFALPYSVRDRLEAGGEPVPLIVYGHGLLDDRTALVTDVTDTTVRGNGRFGPVLQDAEMVAVGTDFWGLTFADTESLGFALSDLDEFQYVPERLIQGTVNFLTLEKSFGGGGACSELVELQVAGRPSIDPAITHYAGVSGGSVTGLTYAAFSDISRFALLVGGASYPLMISRSFAFFPFNLILNTWYEDKIERDVHLAVMASLWEQFDPSTYAARVFENPDRQVLLMTGVDDALVPNVASDFAARTLDLPLQTPAPRRPYAVETVPGPAPSAYTIYDLGREPQSIGTGLPNDNGVHGDVITIDAAHAQYVTFLRDGEVRSTCEGPCDPE